MLVGGLANSWAANISLICKHHSLTSSYAACLAPACVAATRDFGCTLGLAYEQGALGKVANSQPPSLAEQANPCTRSKRTRPRPFSQAKPFAPKAAVTHVVRDREPLKVPCELQFTRTQTAWPSVPSYP